MKNLILIISLFAFLTAQATLIDAQDNFDKKNYIESYKEYLQLAKLGNVEAQYNVSVMLYNGNGIQKNPITAYAWGMVASEMKPESMVLLNIIEKSISKEELKQAKLTGKDLIILYGYNETKLSLGPLPSNIHSNTTLPNERFYILNGKTTTTPLLTKITENKSKNFVDYPNNVIDKGARGWVDLSYEIYPDGSVRDISVIKEYPHKYFTPSAVDFLSKQSFKQSFISQKKADTKMRIKFGIKSLNGITRNGYISGSLNYHQKYQVKNVLNSALAGDLKSQYKYSKYYYTILNRSGGVSEFAINNWLLRAAQFGLIDAQFKLGKNIYQGNGTKVDVQKGLIWIHLAAQRNNAKAQYFLSQHLDKENNFTGKPTSYWLQKSAKNYSIIGQFKYAKQIAKQQNNTQTNLKLATDYLDNYALEIAKTADWYQTKALLQFQFNNYQEAYITIEKAIKLAKKSHWDLAELKQQKIMISQQTNYKA